MAVNSPEVYKPNFRIWERNPIYLYALVNTVVGSLTAFGLSVSTEQAVAIMGIANLVLTLVYGTTVVPLSGAQAAVTQALYTDVPATVEEASTVRPNVKTAVK